jgi:transcriptional regulator
VTVHVYGSFRIIENPQEHQQLLEDLTERHEASQTTPWVAEFDSAPVGDMIGSTVAFEITVTEIQGKFKLNQNRSSSDRTGVIDALENEGSDNATGIAGQMRRLT